MRSRLGSNRDSIFSISARICLISGDAGWGSDGTTAARAGTRAAIRMAAGASTARPALRWCLLLRIVMMRSSRWDLRMKCRPCTAGTGECPTARAMPSRWQA